MATVAKDHKQRRNFSGWKENELKLISMALL